MRRRERKCDFSISSRQLSAGRARRPGTRLLSQNLFLLMCPRLARRHCLERRPRHSRGGSNSLGVATQKIVVGQGPSFLSANALTGLRPGGRFWQKQSAFPGLMSSQLGILFPYGAQVEPPISTGGATEGGNLPIAESQHKQALIFLSAGHSARVRGPLADALIATRKTMRSGFAE